MFTKLFQRIAESDPVKYSHYLYSGSARLIRQLIRENNGRLDERGHIIAKDIIKRKRQLLPFTIIEAVYCALFVNPIKQKHDPVMVLGNWRSGTTFLHDLIASDPNLDYVDAVMSYALPNFMFARSIIEAGSMKAIADSRPMDNVPFDLNSPAEETFGLAGRTRYSFHHLFSFPFNYEHYVKTLILGNLTVNQRKEWMTHYRNEIRKLSYKKDKRLVLKSPDITCKIPECIELFPDARYIYICRDPYRVIRSTVHMLTKTLNMASLQGMPPEEMIENCAISLSAEVYKGYLEQRALIPAGRLIELKYEELVSEPMVILEKIYESIGLPGYEEASTRFQDYLNSQSDYQTNKFVIEDRLKEKINQKLKFVFDAFGYEMISGSEK